MKIFEAWINAQGDRKVKDPSTGELKPNPDYVAGFTVLVAAETLDEAVSTLKEEYGRERLEEGYTIDPEYPNSPLEKAQILGTKPERTYD